MKKKAFTLVEILIVVVILGILAATVIPVYNGQVLKAKESTAKKNLQIFRSTIELYSIQHNDVSPGYEDGDKSSQPSLNYLTFQIVSVATNSRGQLGGPQRTEQYPYGPYLNRLPLNHFNDKRDVRVLGNSEQFPAVPDGSFGWIYQPLTKRVKIDWPGTDTQGKLYYDY